MDNIKKEKRGGPKKATRNCTIPTGGPETNPELYNSWVGIPDSQDRGDDGKYWLIRFV